MSGTPRLALPFLSAGQAQKEFFHNEALQTLDMLVAAAVEEAPRAAPPATPAVGATYIVADSPTGEWAGKPLNLAAYTIGGWGFSTWSSPHCRRSMLSSPMSRASASCTTRMAGSPNFGT